MKTYTPEDVQHIHPIATWNNSAWRGLAGVVIIMLGITAFTAMPKHGQTSWPLVVTMGVITTFFALLLLGSIVQNLRKENWLIKVTGEGIYFNIRVAQNRHLPTPHATILYFMHNEIAGIGLIHEYLRFPGQRGKNLDQNQYLDFHLTDTDTQSIRDCLRAERRLGLESGMFKKRTIEQYPVQLALDPSALRVHWDWVHPKIKQSQRILAQWFFVSEEVRERRILWDKLDDADKLAFMAHLWETGQVRDAACILHVTQRMSPRQCKAWIKENLVDEA